MAGRSRAARTGAGSDGVRITAGRRGRKEIGAILGAAALVALSLVTVARWLQPDAPGRRAASPPAAAAAAELAPSNAPRAGAVVRVEARPRRVTGAAPPPRGGAPSPAEAPDGGPPTHEEPPFSIGSPGSGIALFPKPGTDPVKAGIVVPDDFELPEGFVRHFQVTDDGEPLPAILMFHPDYEWVDANGEPIAIPADGVVPPQLAPPGLPIRMLEVPGAQGAP